MPKRLMAVLLCVLLPGCLLLGLDDRCGDFSRSVSGAAPVPNVSGLVEGGVYVELVEHRKDEPRQTLWWILNNSPLSGHIVAATLNRDSDTSQVLVTLPFWLQPGGGTTMGEIFPYAGNIEFRTLYRMVQRNQVTLVLSTDLLSLPRLTLPLRVSIDEDWSQPHCS